MPYLGSIKAELYRKKEGTEARSMSTKIIMRNRMLKGAICLAAAVMAIIFHNPQTAHAKTIKITAESGKGRDIQNALDASEKDSKNLCIVKVPEGTHRLDRELYIPSNTTLDLRGVTLKPWEPGYRILEFGSVNYGSAGGYRGGKNIKILGGVLDAGTWRNAGNLCTFSHVQNVTFNGTVFKYLPKKKIRASNRNTHMIEFAAAKNVTIKNCKFYNNKNCRPNNEAIQIESIRNERKLLETSPDDLGKRDGTQCKNVTIKDCYFKGFNYGCGSNHLSKKDHFSNMKFIRNTFVGAKKYAICIFGYRNVLISGNKLIKSGRLYLNQGSKGVKAK